MRLGLGIGLGFKVNAILQAFTQKYDPLVIFGSDLVTYYGNSVDELFADHRKAWEDSPELVVNGGFDTNLSGWVVDSGASATWVNGSMQFTTQNTTMRQTISGLFAGSVVRISWKQTILGGTRSRVRIRNLVNNLDLIPMVYHTGSQVATVSVLLTDGGLNLNFLSEVADTFQIDDVSVKVIDPTKLRLYQDSAGTTPVTAVEQFVGLVLDQSQGLDLGPELVTNGDFATDSGWTLTTGAAISDGRLNFSAAAFQNPNAFTALTSSAVGDVYSVTLTISGYVSGGVQIRTYSGGSTSAVLSANGTHTLYVGNIGIPNGNLGIITVGASTTLSIDNLSVKRVLGYHLSQPTATARPRLTRRVNLLSETDNLAAATWGRTRVASPVSSGGAWKIVATNEAGFHRITRTATPLSRSVFTIEAKAAELHLIGVGEGAQTGAWVTVNLLTGELVFPNSNRAKVTPLEDGWWRISVKCFDGDLVAAGAFGVALMPNTATSEDNPHSFSWIGDGVSGVLVRNPQVTQSAIPADNFASSSFVAPTYQRVTSDTDYDEVGFPAKLRFDGTDDALRTGDINLTTTAAISAIGTVLKNSDAAFGVFFEFGPNVSGNNGSFAVLTPPGSAFTGVGFQYKGDGSLRSINNNTFPAPLAAVLSLHANIAGPRIEGFVNGVSAGSVATSAGAGNMGSFPLNVGARNLTTARLNGDIFALPMIVKRLMTPTEMTAAEKAFGKSIGVLQ